MQVGIGLPSTIPGTTGRQIVDWARAAEAADFSSVVTVDRVVYGNYDPFVALGAAAAVTERIRLVTAVLLGPIRQASLLAKGAASLDRLSEGRLDLGLAVGNRQDDYDVTGAPFHRRGKALDEQLDELRAIWAGEPKGMAGAIGPEPVTSGGPRVLIGGASESTWRRIARSADGWISGRGGPADFAAAADTLRKAWKDAGREGEPRLLSLAFFGLGADAQARSEQYIRSYYGYAPFLDALLGAVATTEERVRGAVAAYTEAGCQELLMLPCIGDVEQVDLLRQALS